MIRIVIKVGSLTVTEETGGVSPSKIEKIVQELLELKRQGYFPILVSSGAINSGRALIKKPEEKKMMISLNSKPIIYNLRYLFQTFFLFLFYKEFQPMKYS